MTKQAGRELLKAINPRYLKASQAEKGRILDEFVAATGHNRKYEIHLLRNGPSKRSTRKTGRRRDTAQIPYRLDFLLRQHGPAGVRQADSQPACSRRTVPLTPGGTDLGGTSGPLDPDAEDIVVGDLRVHSSRPEAEVGGRLVKLTTVEHRLLYYLVLHSGQPVSSDQLLEDVWEYPPGTGDPSLVRVHITNLRAKIEPQPDNPLYIRNVHGRGYLIDG